METFPPFPPIIVHWVSPEKMFYQEWEFWLVVLTFVLAVATGWLAWETRGLRRDSAKSIKVGQESVAAATESAKIAQQQFQASIQPIADLHFSSGANHETMAFGRKTYSREGTVSIDNRGQGAFKVRHLYAILQRTADGPLKEQSAVELPEFQNRVIISGRQVQEHVMFDVETVQDWAALCGLLVVCCDMSELVKHEYVWHPIRGIRHRLSIKTD